MKMTWFDAMNASRAPKLLPKFIHEKIKSSYFLLSGSRLKLLHSSILLWLGFVLVVLHHLSI